MNSKYQEYLASDAWRSKREQRLALAGHRCEVCRLNHKMNVHHLTYARIFNEDMADLLPLCEFHHQEAERLIDCGKLCRTGNPIELALETVRMLFRGDQKPKNLPARRTAPLVLSVKQEPRDIRAMLMLEDRFKTALQLPRNKFKRLIKCQFKGKPHKGRFIANAFWIYDHPH